ncbi:MAG: hypothetical protein Ct9H90mP7_2680 [Candidatus Neomarinimicrobiota bacterium]|nr:MAG: hypothetical protein Ct9H90mP7_2680 [Candidatus Neomarinimicrobiota bacterium]
MLKKQCHLIFYEGKKIVNYSLKMTGTEIIDSGLGKFSCKVIKPYSEGKETLQK